MLKEYKECIDKIIMMIDCQMPIESILRYLLAKQEYLERKEMKNVQ